MITNINEQERWVAKNVASNTEYERTSSTSSGWLGLMAATLYLAQISRNVGTELNRLIACYRGKQPKYTYHIQHPRTPNRTRKKQRLTRLQRRRKRQK